MTHEQELHSAIRSLSKAVNDLELKVDRLSEKIGEPTALSEQIKSLDSAIIYLTAAIKGDTITEK